MTTLSLLGRCGLAVCWIAATALAAPVPHPTREGRLVDERDGFSVEYSPGQEAYAEAVFAEVPGFQEAVSGWKARLAAETEWVVRPGSARDLLLHRDEILRAVAATVGLPEATALQGRAFDTMLRYYMVRDMALEMKTVFVLFMTRISAVQIWERGELVRRLGAGEPLEGFTWDVATQELSYRMKTETPGDLVSGEAAKKEFEAVRLDHSFNYRPVAEGVVAISASFTFDKEAKPQPLRPPEGAIQSRGFGRLVRERFRELASPVYPLVLSEKTAGKAPEAVARDTFSDFSGRYAKLGGGAPEPSFLQPVLLYMILHEAAEIALVEHYIGSADRRWLCDGVANYVAWRIVRDRCGDEVARQSYDLDAQLAQYSGQQKQIDLKKWRAVEATKEEDRETPLTKAHYAFATRAVFEMVRQHGEDFLPKLFQEVAKTPRVKVRMATVEKAYRKITGKKLDDVIKFAEETPVVGGK